MQIADCRLRIFRTSGGGLGGLDFALAIVCEDAGLEKSWCGCCSVAL